MTKHMYIVFTLWISVQFQNRNYNLTLGNNATIQCLNYSSLDDITIHWIDSDGVNISNDNTLIISNVVPTLNNTVYVCKVVVDTNPKKCVTENNTIIINVKGK